MSGRAKSKRRSAPTEKFFRAVLDNDPSDDAAKFLFGDLLDECGDPRAMGYCWMVRRRKEPSAATATWDWWHEDSNNRREIVLPDDLWQLLTPMPVERFPNCKEFPSLKAAEEALCVAILELAAAARGL